MKQSLTCKNYPKCHAFNAQKMQDDQNKTKYINYMLYRHCINPKMQT